METPTPVDRSRIDALVDLFATTWREGEPPRLELFLSQVPPGPGRDELLLALLEIEIRHRRAAGDCPRVEDYASRLPGYASTISATIDRLNTVEAAPPPPSAASVSFAELPEYEVLDVLGEGAMGVVYRARHRTLGRPAAIKVILPGRSTDRFRREATLVAAIRSPHVVAVHDFRGLADGRFALVMELVDGSDLRAVMRANGGRIPEEQAVRWMADVCEGMIAAAERGIIHRDLKPQNILIDDRRRALVADFGLARGEGVLPDVTTADTVMGTPQYMAPEQAEDPRGVDTRADIYSFGAAFYHALTGSPPFDGASAFSILCKHKSEPLASPRSRNPDISERIGAVLERCLAKAPGDRFPSFAELRRQLTTAPGPFSPWDMTEDPELLAHLERYRARRDAYLDPESDLPAEGEAHAFPGGRRVVILRGDITRQDVDAVVSSDTHRLTHNFGVSLAIGEAGGRQVVDELARYGPVRPGRAVVTSGGRLPARYVFHGVTVGITGDGIVEPSRDLIAEIMASCFYHADSLQVGTIAFPLLGTGAMGFSREICLDTMFQSLARTFLRGLGPLREARIVIFPEEAPDWGRRPAR
ncbi:Serine/threonine-protein kinase PknB [Aquisphaera giovannonii]|uniref:Serine/threonine-protein kinase PknB n=1 Tax=Aquisphaera giovannonii TaxID=406548 RepID=A0A5B9W820_9BACT|nr:serine/threonine-protein kinase [Aquisphaera giovannonii]QEH36151.1 Serine/threonine-protein kinase PknB [Aquisphaera giovannonii]